MAGDFRRGKPQILGAARGITSRLTSMFSGVAASLGMMAGAGAFVQLLRGGEDFNRKMRNSLAIMGDVSGAMQGEMKQAAYAAASATQFGAGQAAEAYFFLASAGLDAKQSIAAMPQVAMFAQAGMFDLARATDLATDAQSALGMTVKDSQQNLTNMKRVTDVLVKANTLANASVEQFSLAITTKAGAAARVVGKDIEELTAVLAAFADQGMKGQEAGTAINIVFRDLQTKAIQNKDAFREHGIAVFDDAGKMRNMADVVAELEKALAGMSDEQKKLTLAQLGFADKSMIFLQTLLGTSDKIRNYEKELRKAGGTTKAVADKQMTPLQKATAKLGASVTELSASIMKTLGPIIGRVFGGIVSLLGAVRRGAEIVVRFFTEGFGRVILLGGSVVAILLAVKVAATGLGIVLSAAFTVATGPIGAVILLMTALGAVIVETTGKGNTFGEKMKDVFENKVPKFIETLKFTFRNFGAIAELAIINLVQTALELFPQLDAPLVHAASVFIGAWAGVKAFFENFVVSVIGGLLEIKNMAVAVWVGMKAAWESMRGGDFKGAASAFGQAFIETLAKQKDVEAPNIYKAVKDSYTEAQGEMAKALEQVGGFGGALAARKQTLLDRIAGDELKRTKASKKAGEKEAAEAAEAKPVMKLGVSPPVGESFLGAGRFGFADFGKRIQDAMLKRDDPQKQIAKNTAKTAAGVAGVKKAISDSTRGFAGGKGGEGRFPKDDQTYEEAVASGAVEPWVVEDVKREVEEAVAGVRDTRQALKDARAFADTLSQSTRESKVKDVQKTLADALARNTKAVDTNTKESRVEDIKRALADALARNTGAVLD